MSSSGWEGKWWQKSSPWPCATEGLQGPLLGETAPWGGCWYQSKNQEEKAPGGNFQNAAGLEKMGFSESIYSCTRISDNGRACKSAAKLCRLLMEMSFVSRLQGDELWVRPALQVVGIYRAWINERKIGIGEQALKWTWFQIVPFRPEFWQGWKKKFRAALGLGADCRI